MIVPVQLQASIFVGYSTQSSQVTVGGFFDLQASDNELNGTRTVASLDTAISKIDSIYTSTELTGLFSLRRTGGQFDDSTGSMRAQFIANANLRYAIDGTFRNSAGEAYLSVFLRDDTAGQIIFENQQTYEGGVMTLNVGEAAGNKFNRLSGSQSGLLQQGHFYSFSIQAYTKIWDVDGDNGTPAFGRFSLNTLAVPEPTSLAIWGSCLLALAGLNRRRVR